MKLEEKNKLYHNIVFVLFQLLNYYESLFFFYAGESARELSCKLITNEAIQTIQASVPIIKELPNSYTLLEMKIIFNEYLPLLLQGSDIPPYAEKRHRLPTEPLYVIDITTDGDYYFVTFLFIDSPEAYRRFLQDKSATLTKII